MHTNRPCILVDDPWRTKEATKIDHIGDVGQAAEEDKEDCERKQQGFEALLLGRFGFWVK